MDENNWDAAALLEVMQLDVIDAGDLERGRKSVDVSFLRCELPKRQEEPAQQRVQLSFL